MSKNVGNDVSKDPPIGEFVFKFVGNVELINAISVKASNALCVLRAV